MSCYDELEERIERVKQLKVKHPRFMCAIFVQKSFRQLFSSYVQLCDFWHQNFVQKSHAQNVDEIDTMLLQKQPFMSQWV